MKELTADRARALFAYDPESGRLAWKIARGRVRAGASVSCVSSDGYLLVRVDKQLFLAHRIIWLLQMGEWPSLQVDHKNGVRLDNRWSNLRELNNTENVQNQRRAHVKNKTGLLGATIRGNRFSAQIKTEGVGVHLGYFGTAVEAHEAYVNAKRESHRSCTL